jgi:aspartokinase
LNESEGTLVASKEQIAKEGMEDFRFVGVTSESDQMPLEVMLARPTVLGAVLERARDAGLTAFSPLFESGRLWVFVDRSSESEWKKILERLCLDEFVKDFRFRDDLAPLSVVGECLCQDGTIFSRIIETLGKQSISVEFATASASAWTGAIPQNKVDDAVQLLHSEFSG